MGCVCAAARDTWIWGWALLNVPLAWVHPAVAEHSILLGLPSEVKKKKQSVINGWLSPSALMLHFLSESTDYGQKEGEKQGKLVCAHTHMHVYTSFPALSWRSVIHLTTLSCFISLEGVYLLPCGSWAKTQRTQKGSWQQFSCFWSCQVILAVWTRQCQTGLSTPESHFNSAWLPPWEYWHCNNICSLMSRSSITAVLRSDETWHPK